MSEYRRVAYFGRMTSTALPRISSSRLRPDTMSPRLPARNQPRAPARPALRPYRVNEPAPHERRSAAPGRTAGLVLAGLDVGHEGVVGEPGGFLVFAAGVLGCSEEGLQRGAVAG